MPKITAVGETTGTLSDGRHQPDEARRPLRVAIAGTGFIGEVHAGAVRRAGARLVGVAASTPERGRAAARLLGAETGFAHAEAMATSPDVDVVHVCTPNHLHAALAEAALAAGKHVVCEKPLAIDAGAARRLAAAAAASGAVATVPFVYRFYPLVREARARVAAGAIGPVRLIHGCYLQDWLATEDDDNWRVDADLAGGRSRAFADIGSHWCDLVEFVSGDRLAAVCAEAVTAVPERVRRAGAGPHAFAAPVAGSEADAAGAGGTGRRPVTTEDIDARAVPHPPRGRRVGRDQPGLAGPQEPPAVRGGRRGGDRSASTRSSPSRCGSAGGRRPSRWSRDSAHLAPAAAPYAVLPPGHPQGYQDCFDAFVADTYGAIRAGDAGAVDGLPTFADGARAADITDAVLRSAKGGTWEEVPQS